jgi:hypothetical protein
MAERKIGSATFKAEKLPARDSQKLLLRVGKMIGPGLSNLVAAMQLPDEEGRDAAAVKVVSDMIAGVSIEEADDLLVYLCSQALIKEDKKDYEEVVFDHHLGDDLALAWQVAYFVLEANFRDFFGAAAKSGLGKALMKAKDSPKKS